MPRYKQKLLKQFMCVFHSNPKQVLRSQKKKPMRNIEENKTTQIKKTKNN